MSTEHRFTYETGWWPLKTTLVELEYPLHCQIGDRRLSTPLRIWLLMAQYDSWKWGSRYFRVGGKDDGCMIIPAHSSSGWCFTYGRNSLRGTTEVDYWNSSDSDKSRDNIGDFHQRVAVEARIVWALRYVIPGSSAPWHRRFLLPYHFLYVCYKPNWCSI
jgi:hypothetical protein